MKKSLLILATVSFGAGCIYAQDAESNWPVNWGFKVGIPVTDMFSAGNTTQFDNNQNVPDSAFTPAVPRYEFGVSGEFHLPKHLRFEASAL